MKYNDLLSLLLRYLTQSVAGYLLLRFFPGNNFKPKNALIITGVIMLAYIILEYLVFYLYVPSKTPMLGIKMVDEIKESCSSCAKPKKIPNKIEGFAEEIQQKTVSDEKSNDDSMVADELQEPRHTLTANKYLLDADYKEPGSDVPLATAERTNSDWDTYMNKKEADLMKEKSAQAQQFMIDEETRLQAQADLIKKRREELKNNATQYEKDLQARMDPYNDPPKKYSGSDEKSEVVTVSVPAKKVSMGFVDFNSLPVPDNYVTANEEFGYSYLKAEDWEKITPPHIPVCVSDTKSPVFASYTDGAPLDAKIWYNSRFSTNFRKVDNDKIKTSLDHK